MEGDRFFYLMVVVIALIGIGLFAIPVRAHGDNSPHSAGETASNPLASYSFSPAHSCAHLLLSGPSVSGMRRV
jgi:hypothetical protein